MPINANITTINYDDQRARTPDSEILTLTFEANQGILPVGLILAKDAAGLCVPYAEPSGEVLGTGNGTLKNFTGNTAMFPVNRGSFTATDGNEVFTDDTCGRLVGSKGGSGTVNYVTGAFALAFNSAVANNAQVTGAYCRKIRGVLDEILDTSAVTSGLAIVHGRVRQDVLKLGVAGAVPSAAALQNLEDMDIWAV